MLYPFVGLQWAGKAHRRVCNMRFAPWFERIGMGGGGCLVFVGWATHTPGVLSMGG